MKDVVVCDKPRLADKQAFIRGCPNGETRLTTKLFCDLMTRYSNYRVIQWSGITI